MRIRRHSGEDEGIIDLSSLLDVLFILIIFLMATSNFEEMEVDEQVQLPVQASSDSLSSESKAIVINVRKSGTYVLQNQQMTIEEMHEHVKAALEENPELKVLVRADQEALHGWVANAIAVCRDAGVLKANIGYKLLY